MASARNGRWFAATESCSLLHSAGMGERVWCLGTDSESPWEDAKGGVGTPSAPSCLADVWHFSKWCKMSNSFPTVKISVLGRATFYKVQHRQCLVTSWREDCLGTALEDCFSKRKHKTCYFWLFTIDACSTLLMYSTLEQVPFPVLGPTWCKGWWQRAQIDFLVLLGYTHLQKVFK